MVGVLDERRQSTVKRLNALRDQLVDSAELLRDTACVYVTGSFARGEAGEFSDLDLFIVGGGDKKQRELKGLDEICLKADLIRATREMSLPEFSTDGEYLTHFTIDELVDGLGKPDDDATNTFTARLLLLLESSPLLGEKFYGKVIDEVISAYWRDYEDRQLEFMPAFLTNDVLRIWRTFCVNYEARTAKEPPEKKAKRKLKNFRLKHSRMLTCYSGLLYLQSLYRRKGTVTPDDAREMVSLSPTQRLEWLKKEDPSEKLSAWVDELLRLYELFLSSINAREEELIKAFLDAQRSKKLMASAYEFGDKIFNVMELIATEANGSKNRFYRLLVV